MCGADISAGMRPLRASGHLRTRLPSVRDFYSFFWIAVSSGSESDVVNGCGNPREATLLPVAPFPPSASVVLPVRLAIAEFRPVRQFDRRKSDARSSSVTASITRHDNCLQVEAGVAC